MVIEGNLISSKYVQKGCYSHSNIKSQSSLSSSTNNRYQKKQGTMTDGEISETLHVSTAPIFLLNYLLLLDKLEA